MWRLTSLWLLLFVPGLGVAGDSKMPPQVQQYNLGTAYWYGVGREKDYNKACDLFEKAAESGFGSAQFNLGNCYRTGQGRAKSLENAIEWYKKAVGNKVVPAMSTLGALYINEEQDEKLHEQGIQLLQDAMDDGDVNAPFVLGTAYYRGRGVERNLAEALDAYREAAYRGNVLAQALLALIYTEGMYGQQVDMERAAFWRQMVNMNPNPDRGKRWTVEYALAGIYKNGWGVPQSDERFQHYMEISGEDVTGAKEKGTAGRKNEQ